MLSDLAGIGGSLFPGHFLAERADGGMLRGGTDPRRLQAHLGRWWRSAEATCGPSTSLRAVFDGVACPLLGALGFRVRDPRFDADRIRARLDTPGGGRVALLQLPWAARPSRRWREAWDAARDAGSRWCLVLAPPYLSVVDARRHGARRAVEFTLPDALEVRSLTVLVAVAGAGAFEGAPVVAIEALVADGHRFQDRVREDLQHGVAESLGALAALAHRATAREAAFDEALTIVYRILFLLFAESRALVPAAHPILAQAYTVGGLCRDALDGSTRGVWDGLAAITRLSRVGCRTGDLIVWPFNGPLFARRSAPALESPARGGRQRRGGTPARDGAGRDAESARDAALGRALVALGTRRGRHGRQTIRYADLGVEQLGAVYERVLDMEAGPHPGKADVRATTAAPAPATAPGAEAIVAPAAGANIVSARRRARPAGGHSAHRKATGTFYTPRPLADFVVRRTLAPLVAGASVDRILSLRVLDPAMGSGAFLVAACRFLADACERAMIAEGRCAETDLDAGMRASLRRRVAERCLAGVDVNPVAVRVARLSVWLTSLAHRRPLGFLDHRLRVGHSLIGASPEDLRRVPDLAHGRRDARGVRGAPGARGTPQPGARGHRRRPPQADRALPLFEAGGLDLAMRRMTRSIGALLDRPDETVGDVHAKAAAWRRLAGPGSPIEAWRDAASLWCARWFWSGPGGDGSPPSAAELRAAIDGRLGRDATLPRATIDRWCRTAATLARRHGFFHWPLEFADVFYEPSGEPRADPGFDAIVGNPPWEMLRDDGRAPGDEAGARAATARFLRDSGLYPDSTRGHVNLYLPFLERSLSLLKREGRLGLVLPWGFASDDGATVLRRRLVEGDRVDTLVGCDNGDGLFPVHRGLRFLALVAGPAVPGRETRARFGVRRAEDLSALPSRDAEDDPAAVAAWPVRLTAEVVGASGGRAGRIPDVRRASDLSLLTRLTRAFPRLGDAAGAGATFGRDLNATDHRAHFGTTGLPVLEGKDIAPFVAHVPDAPPRPAPATGGSARPAPATGGHRRIAPSVAARLLPDRRFTRPRLAYRDVSGVGNRVSLIAAILPAGVVTTHTLFCQRQAIAPPARHYLCALLNSYVLNALARMLMGGHLTTSLVEDLPAPAWCGSSSQRRIAAIARAIAARVRGGGAGRRAVLTPSAGAGPGVPAGSRRPAGSHGPAARRRPAGPTEPAGTRASIDLDVRLEARLQAAVAHLYGLGAAEYAGVLDTFPLVPEASRRAAFDAFVATRGAAPVASDAGRPGAVDPGPPDAVVPDPSAL
ncbi:MAG: N-6 DNA methylase [Vicinamibacterales bacterium]